MIFVRTSFGLSTQMEEVLVSVVLVLVAGIAGSILHTGLFFAPALVVLAVGGVKLWRERPGARRGVV